MASSNKITTTWLGQMAFESNNPSGIDFRIDASPEDGGEGQGLRPKALMLSSLAGCSGLDVASMIGKMRLQVDDFRIDIEGILSETQPQTYTQVKLDFHFYGARLNRPKLERAVKLSVEKYCGVYKMFRTFAEMQYETIFHEGENT